MFSVALSDFRYELVDLDPNDGIVPAVTFDTGSTLGAGWYPPGSTMCDCQYANGAIGSAFSVSGTQGSFVASAAASAGNPAGTGLGPGLSVSVNGFEPGAGGQAYGYAVIGAFSLTPNTRLVFTASTSGLSASTSILGQAVSANAAVQLSNQTQDLISFENSNLYIDVNGVQSSNLLSTVTASFTNASGGAVGGYAFVSASVSILDVRAVPEPSTYAFMLVGLLSLGLAVRRKRSG